MHIWVYHCAICQEEQQFDTGIVRVLWMLVDRFPWIQQGICWGCWRTVWIGKSRLVDQSTSVEAH